MPTLQQPLHSGLNAASTPADVMKGIELNGKTAIVTGGYSGIGIPTVRALRAAGARVIVPGRDVERASAALTGIPGVEVNFLDLTDPSSIRTFARLFVTSGQPLHLLINSAGIMACPLTRDARGYEFQFSTNHLGHFQLTTLLWPSLQKAQGARIVAVSSWGHRRSPVVFEDPNYERRPYDRWLAYGQSKTANVLMAVDADRRGNPEGIRAFAVHPGIIMGTGLDKHMTAEEVRAFGVLDAQGKAIIDPNRNMKTVDQGATTSLWCAVSPQLAGLGGVYCENGDISPIRAPETVASGVPPTGGTGAQGVLPHAIDPVAAERLWALSEQLIAR